MPGLVLENGRGYRDVSASPRRASRSSSLPPTRAPFAKNSQARSRSRRWTGRCRSVQRRQRRRPGAAQDRDARGRARDRGLRDRRQGRRFIVARSSITPMRGAPAARWTTSCSGYISRAGRRQRAPADDGLESDEIRLGRHCRGKDRRSAIAPVRSMGFPARASRSTRRTTAWYPRRCAWPTACSRTRAACREELIARKEAADLRKLVACIDADDPERRRALARLALLEARMEARGGSRRACRSTGKKSRRGSLPRLDDPEEREPAPIRVRLVAQAAHDRGDVSNDLFVGGVCPLAVGGEPVHRMRVRPQPRRDVPPRILGIDQTVWRPRSTSRSPPPCRSPLPCSGTRAGRTGAAHGSRLRAARR